MNMNETAAFRQWLSKNGYEPKQTRDDGAIMFKRVDSEAVYLVFPLARGGATGNSLGHGVYQRWRQESGLGPGGFQISVRPVSPDIAVELCLHHLQLALSYFEATPDDQCAQLFEEAERMLDEPSGYELGYVKALVTALKDTESKLLQGRNID